MGGLTKLRAPAYDSDERYEIDLLDAPAMPFPAVLTQFAVALTKLGVTNPLPEEHGGQKIGEGSFGAAYRLRTDPPTVLKLTKDYDEAMASGLLRGQSPRHVVNVYEVWALKGSQRNAEELEWYAVRREYLRPFSPRDQALLEDLDKVADDFDLLVPTTRTWMRRWANILRDRFREHPADVKRALQILVQVAEGTRELRKLGVEWTDFHPDNILRSNTGASVKIVDVGAGMWRRDYDVQVRRIYPDGSG